MDLHSRISAALVAGLIFLYPIFSASGADFAPPAYFANPPTGPSRSNNTWLLGVWEATAGDGSQWTATVTPMTSDRFQIAYQRKAAPKIPALSGTAEGWISRVGLARLLVLDSKGALPGFVVAGFQLLTPLEVRTREIILPPGAESETAYRLRKAIRTAYKDGTLFSGREAVWKKSAEITWNPRLSPTSQTFTPVRNVLPQPAGR